MLASNEKIMPIIKKMEEDLSSQLVINLLN
jgi:hypothetical protein